VPSSPPRAAADLLVVHPMWSVPASRARSRNWWRTSILPHVLSLRRILISSSWTASAALKRRRTTSTCCLAASLEHPGCRSWPPLTATSSRYGESLSPGPWRGCVNSADGGSFLLLVVRMRHLRCPAGPRRCCHLPRRGWELFRPRLAGASTSSRWSTAGGEPKHRKVRVVCDLTQGPCA
jgi:hypothetical protein